MLCFVTKSVDRYAELFEQLTDRGVFLFFCRPEDAVRLCTEKDTGAVIVDHRSSPKEAREVLLQLHGLYPQMPLAALTDRFFQSPVEPLCYLQATAAPDELFRAVLQFCTDSYFYTGMLSTFYLSLSPDDRSCYYMGFPLKLSKRQFRILHCLFYRSPRLTPSADLMSLCYLTKKCDPDNLFIQISKINQKAAAYHPSPLIVNEYAKGYRLRSGIYG